MSEPTAMVSFRLDRESPMRIEWRAKDGTPGDGYKPQVTAFLFADGTKLVMHGSSILEQVAADGSDFVITFNGMVGFAADHADRPRIEALAEEDVAYELELVHEDGRIATEGRDYKVVEQPKARARRLGRA